MNIFLRRYLTCVIKAGTLGCVFIDTKTRSSHYSDVMMRAMASQITSLTIVYSAIYSRRRSQSPTKLRVTGLCEGNSPVTGEFPAQRASNAENVSIWWRHHMVSAKCTQVSPVVHLVTPLPCVLVSINTQPSTPAMEMYKQRISWYFAF